MRLLNTSTLQLEDFVDQKAPKYAILSHTWGKPEEEVSYLDMKTPSHKVLDHPKLVNSCALAKDQSLSYIWIDTCCIDKSSSAELSEAINSMYRWYQNAEICYVYLSDIWLSSKAPHSSKFVKSRWFTRGWTLQELIAPRFILFFDAEWQELGSKNSLQSYISLATGIDTDVLCDLGALSGKSVATKMFWASSRETSRIEDLAYCLLGIFNVNLPLLYGEGRRAFLRLQEEIIRNTSDDESIYAWMEAKRIRGRGRDGSFRRSGMLAASPGMFSYSGYIERIDLFHGPRTSPTSITNRSLTMKLMIRKFAMDSEWAGCYEAPLACADKRNPEAAFKLILCQDKDQIAPVLRGRMEFFGKMLNEEEFVPRTFLLPLYCTEFAPRAVHRRYLSFPTHQAPIVLRISQGSQEHLRLTERSMERTNHISPGQWTFPPQHIMNTKRDVPIYQPNIIRCWYKSKDIITIITNPSVLMVFVAEHNAANERGGTTSNGISRFVDVEKECVSLPNYKVEWKQPKQSTGIGDLCTIMLEEGVGLDVSSKVNFGEKLCGCIQISLNLSSIDRQALFSDEPPKLGYQKSFKSQTSESGWHCIDQ